MKLQTWTLSVLTLLSIAAGADTTSRHIADLDRGGFLAPPTGSAPVFTAVAGLRFLNLVPDSQREVCRIVLEHHARKIPGLYRLQVVDSLGRKLMACEL